jgi:hypothetical protein
MNECNAVEFNAVSMDELNLIEGGFLGISWDDVKKAAKFVAGVIVTAIVTKEVGKHL